MVQRRAPWAMAMLAATALVAASAPASAGAVSTAKLEGRVLSAKAPLASFKVSIYAARGKGADSLRSARTDRRGAFTLSYRRPSKRGTIFYVLARRGPVTLASVLGAEKFPSRIVVNERTTVASAYSMAQFAEGTTISGPSPGLQNATRMARNLVKLATGGLSKVLRTYPNGGSTSALRSFNSLANMVAACVRKRKLCGRLFALARPARGKAPRTTLQAMVNVARDPGRRRTKLFRLARTTRLYSPARSKRPSAWLLALRFDGDGHTMSGPGNFAIDAKGTLWVANNYEYARPRTIPVCGSKLLLRFTPEGRYFPGSPYTGGGVSGVGYGIGIDPKGNVWTGNFGFAAPVPGCPADRQPTSNSISKFSPKGKALSPDTGYTAGGVSWPQGTVSDHQGNIWAANCGNDSVTRSPAGDPNWAVNLSGLGIEKPFDVAIGRRARAFVSGLDNSKVAVLNNDGTPTSNSPVSGGGINRPMGLASDSKGNIWVANSGVVDIPCPPPPDLSSGSFGGSVTMLDPDGNPIRDAAFTGGGLTIPWGITVDGDDNVWVANFGGRRISHLCGTRPQNCPPKKKTGDALSPKGTGYGFEGLRRVTAVQIDPSGNAWLTNNWKIDPAVPVNGVFTLQNPGGFEIVVYVGIAAPVKSPQIGPVRAP